MEMCIRLIRACAPISRAMECVQTMSIAFGAASGRPLAIDRISAPAAALAFSATMTLRRTSETQVHAEDSRLQS